LVTVASSDNRNAFGVGITPWIETEDRDRSLVGNAIAFDALHRGGLSGTRNVTSSVVHGTG
jgi:hypothetical protein